MRRTRDIREHREALRRKQTAQRQRRKDKAKAKALKAREARKANLARRRMSNAKHSNVPSRHEFKFNFRPFDDYQCSATEPIRVCHVIESLGMGGGQTMMMELIRGLDKHYEGQILNLVACPRATHSKYKKALYQSYGITPNVMREKELSRFVANHNIQIVVQHRLAVSKCLKPLIPSAAKYIVMNHTYHQLPRLANIIKADLYVSVCNYLCGETKWAQFIHPSRRLVILNGVENDYISDIKPHELEGEFKTGRCHRLVANKFRADSIPWIDKNVRKAIPGHRHYLLGHNAEAKKKCKKSKSCRYFGTVADRHKKMSILKSLDLYFYETFGQEGASIAILESLACGVPVLCRNFGGNKELVKDGVNGYVLKDREEFLLRMKDLQDRDKLEALKESTKNDFDRRLHVRHTASKYMQLFEALL